MDNSLGQLTFSAKRPNASSHTGTRLGQIRTPWSLPISRSSPQDFDFEVNDTESPGLVLPGTVDVVLLSPPATQDGFSLGLTLDPIHQFGSHGYLGDCDGTKRLTSVPRLTEAEDCISSNESVCYTCTRLYSAFANQLDQLGVPWSVKDPFEVEEDWLTCQVHVHVYLYVPNLVSSG